MLRQCKNNCRKNRIITLLYSRSLALRLKTTRHDNKLEASPWMGFSLNTERQAMSKASPCWYCTRALIVLSRVAEARLNWFKLSKWILKRGYKHNVARSGDVFFKKNLLAHSLITCIMPASCGGQMNGQAGVSSNQIASPYRLNSISLAIYTSGSIAKACF